MQILQRQCIIVYRTHLDKDLLREWMIQRLGDYESIVIHHLLRYDTPFTWVLVATKRPFRCTNPSLLDYGVDFKVMTVTNGKIWNKICFNIGLQEVGSHEPEVIAPIQRRRPIIFKCKCGLMFESESALNAHACPTQALNESAIRNSTECVVCMDAEKSIVLLPCRHAQLCNSCAESCKQRDGLCPTCRVEIKEILPIYT